MLERSSLRIPFPSAFIGVHRRLGYLFANCRVLALPGEKMAAAETVPIPASSAARIRTRRHLPIQTARRRIPNGTPGASDLLEPTRGNGGTLRDLLTALTRLLAQNTGSSRVP